MGCHWFLVVSAPERVNSSSHIHRSVWNCHRDRRTHQHENGARCAERRPTKSCSSCPKWLNGPAGKTLDYLRNNSAEAFLFFFFVFVLVSRSQLCCLLLFIFFSCCAVFYLSLSFWCREKGGHNPIRCSANGPRCGGNRSEKEIRSIRNTVEAMRSNTLRKNRLDVGRSSAANNTQRIRLWRTMSLKSTTKFYIYLLRTC